MLNVLQAITLGIDNMMATFMTLVNISCFVSFFLRPLLPSYIVFSLGFYMRLCYSIGFYFTRSLVTLINALVSIDRISEFLQMKELSSSLEKISYYDSIGINVENLNFKWENVSNLIFKFI